MKQKLAGLAAFLLICSGCGAQKKPAVPAPAEPAPQVEEVPAPPVEEEPDVVEIPMEINPERPMCDDGVETPGEDADFNTVMVEDLIEDTVAYNLEKPVFKGLNGADKINSFYETIILNLENFSKSQIYDDAVGKSAIASVYGTVEFAQILDGKLEVQYRFRAEFSDDTQQENVRNDLFDVETGDLLQP